jgi:hypothetical protein
MITDHNTRYTSAVDIWSIGVTFYKMIYKIHPWRNQNGSSDITRAELKVAVKNQSGINLYFFPFPQISHEAKDLLRKMIEPNPTKRITLHGIIMHPAFLFIHQKNLKPSDGSLNQQQKAQKVLNEMLKKPDDFFKKLNFEMGSQNSTDPLFKPIDEAAMNMGINQLANRLTLPELNPLHEFIERNDHETFYIRFMLRLASTIFNFITSEPIFEQKRYSLTLLWNCLVLYKKAASYSLYIFSNLKSRVNIYNISGFDEKVKNSNGYENELSNIQYSLMVAQEELKYTLEKAKSLKILTAELTLSEEFKLHQQVIEFCEGSPSQQTINKKFKETLSIFIDFYIKMGDSLGFRKDLTTIKWIVLLDILCLNEIEIQVANDGANGFSREKFFMTIQNQAMLNQKLEDVLSRYRNK